ncbi:prepilin-type N-terminal cleavage/methylation domain-containing protein [Sporichthya sp.]|uniref:prepilin-type N-terminal cleavage/methylation domain-containing protein n=1 Tax=Sporichthya sp. TaxID=65475 RepID=UPI0017B6B8A0|nr:prepilin-type N-terminal cleavage/methylation domain-containing protein [Sporichthya sp.]
MYTALRKSLNKENDKGFTLIELLVVIIIIGILAAIAIPIFLNQRKKATDASMKSDTRSIATQVETFYTDDQTYPVALNISTAGTAPTVLTVGTETVIMSPGNTPVVKSNATSGTATDATAVCIEVSNPKGSHTFVWISNLGGLQPSTVTVCPGTIATVL